MGTADLLHERFNKRSSQIPPVRVKGFTRGRLAKLFGEMGFVKGAEIGVAGGRYSLTLCQHVPGLKLTCVDPWARYPGNPRAHRTEKQERCYQEARTRLSPYGAHIVRAKSMEYVNEVEDRSLDFVYIDGNHCFDFVMQDLIEWGKKVRRGGIISGHDYYRFRWAGVVDAVDVYVRAHQVQEWFLTDEREPSFFWAV